MTAPAMTDAQHEAVVGWEWARLGQGETPPGSNNTPEGAWYGDNGQPWCAMFQSDAHYEVLGYSPFPASTSKGFASCYLGARWFQAQGAWAGPDVTPLRGWLVFFRWPGDSIEHHVGKVLGAQGPGSVDTIEGNTSDLVQLHHRASSISGYGIIDRTAPPPPPHEPPPPLRPYPHLTHTLGPGLQTNPAAALADIYAVQFLQDRANILLERHRWPGAFLPGFGGHAGWDGLTTMAVVWLKDRVNADYRQLGAQPPFPVAAGGHPNIFVGPKTLDIFTRAAAGS